MKKEELDKLNKLSRTKLTGTVRIDTHEAFRIASLKERKTVGELLDEIAQNYPLISKWLPEK